MGGGSIPAGRGEFLPSLLAMETPQPAFDGDAGRSTPFQTDESRSHADQHPAETSCVGAKAITVKRGRIANIKSLWIKFVVFILFSPFKITCGAFCPTRDDDRK